MSNICPSCSQPTTPGAVFCDNCGFNLSAGAGPAPMPPAAAPGAGLAPCPACGTGNVPGAMFCENCGASLAALAPAPMPPMPEPIPPMPQPWQAPAPVPAPVSPPAPQAWAPPAAVSAITGQFIIQSSGTPLAIPPGKTEILIGREDPVSGNFPDIDLDPHDGLNQGVSRQHAKVTLQGGQLMVEDLNAVNKTHLRGQQLTPGQKYPLNSGDELVLGRLRLIYNN